MIPRRILGATHRFGPPEGWDEKRDGMCANLFVRMRREGGTTFCESAWEPTPEELAMLNAGGSVVLRIVGAQPPVALYTTVAFQDGNFEGACEGG